MDDLKRLGLNAYEIGIYESLLEYGRIDAKKISEHSAVPQTAVYPNLRSLIKKGLIQEISGKVKSFEALDPNIAIKSYVEKKKDELDSLYEEMKPKISNIMTKEQSQDESIISISKGVQSAFEIYFDLFSKTKKTLYMVGWGFKIKKNMYKLMHEMIKLKNSGVDLRIIINSKKEKESILAHMNAVLNIRYLDLKNISIAISDTTECKITLKNPALKDRYSLQIKDKDLSKAMNDYFLVLWDRAK
jgi:sugar-specific transcriptional regulator TrmB